MSDCKYFPCHDLDKVEFDCSLCYCHFYDICKKTKKYGLFGGYILKQNGVLACEKCVYFHRKDIVREYNELITEGLTMDKIYMHFVDKIKRENDKC